MAKKTVAKVNIEVNDKGSATFKSFSDKAENNLEKVANSSKNVTTRMTSQWKTVRNVLAGAVVIKGFKDVITAASDLQETTSKFNTVFRGVEDSANKFTSTLTSSYGLSTQAARQFLASTQDLFVPLGLAREKASKLSNKVVQLAVDLGSFNNLRTENVMADIQSALVGNYETMKKYGVVLNETVVQQKAFSMGLAKTKNDMTAASKAQAAYALIVSGSTDAIGDFNRTQDSFANQMKILLSRFEDLKAAIGSELLPIVTDYITRLNEWFKSNEDIIKQNLPEYIDKITTIVKILAGIMGTMFVTNVIGNLINFGVVVGNATKKTIKFSKTLASIYGKQKGLASITTAAERWTLQFGKAGTALESVMLLFANPYFLGAAAVVGAIGLAWWGAVKALDKYIDKQNEQLRGQSLENLIREQKELFKTIDDANKAIEYLQKNPTPYGGEAIIGAQKNIDIAKRRLKVVFEEIAKLSGKAFEGFEVPEEIDTKAQVQMLREVEKTLTESHITNLKLNHKYQEAEIAEVREKYKTLIEENKKYSNVVKQLEINRELEISAINKKYSDKLIKVYNSTTTDNLKLLGQTKQAEIIISNQKYDALIKEYEKYTNIKNMLIQSKNLNENAIEKKYSDKGLDLLNQTNIEYLNSTKQFSKALALEENIRYQKLKDEIDAAYTNESISATEHYTALEQAKTTHNNKMAKITEESNAVLKSINENMTQALSSGFTDAFMNIIEGTQSVTEAFYDMTKNIASEIIRMTMQMAIIQPIAKSISGFITGVPSAKGNVFNQGNLVPFANGGVINKPTVFPLGIAGEAGPEAIIPLKRGKGGKLGVESSGNGNISNNVSFNNTFQFTGEDTNEKRVRQMQRMLEQQMTQYVYKNKLPGGLLSSTAPTR